MEKDNCLTGPAKPRIAERLAEKLSMAANSATIYGEPVERDGVTVIPVSKASYGFGGGEGAGTEGKGSGSGGGGGMALTPIGYIEIKQGATRFRTIRDPQTVVKIVAISSLALFLTTKTIVEIFKNKSIVKLLKK
ncbi:spore germination protein GerW family protein [Pontibacter anaerobius]|uniref:Spore germination protein GerW family protein n=1 Tax=Pontibacter anaerobius TaxID=2993940 RepID=A0ABT3RGD3_9BACT|nr:spore germination protein GerW family protein [Pontibacter anaerobius]MCX2740897.1 spore germination protein GerW family protein [Pontibacter anaerobius]